jgi:hypothetical protein
MDPSKLVDPASSPERRQHKSSGWVVTLLFAAVLAIVILVFVAIR